MTKAFLVIHSGGNLSKSQVKEQALKELKARFDEYREPCICVVFDKDNKVIFPFLMVERKTNFNCLYFFNNSSYLDCIGCILRIVRYFFFLRKEIKTLILFLIVVRRYS